MDGYIEFAITQPALFFLMFGQVALAERVTQAAQGLQHVGVHPLQSEQRIAGGIALAAPLR